MKKINNEITTILEESIYPVSYQLKTPINVNNGIMNEQMLERAKRAFVMETVGTWQNELVKTAQGYPVDDISDVIFTIDCVIIKRQDFDKLKELV